MMTQLNCACLTILVTLLISSSLVASNNPEHDDEKLHESQIPPPAEQPSPQEIQTELARLFKHADEDNNEKLAVEEIKKWLDTVHGEIIKENIDRQWAYFEPVMQEVHSWHEYKPTHREVVDWEKYHGKTFPDEVMNDPANPEEYRKSLEVMLERAKRRWEAADHNNDTILVKEEFKDFMHPEESESERVQEVLIKEAIEDMDTDGNELISLEEYINHITAITAEQERADPEWTEVQKNHFLTYLDKNKDGSLDKDELKHWLSPQTDRHTEEAASLVDSADEDKDQMLSVEEILNNYNNFFTLIPPKFWAKYYPDEQLYGTADKRHDEL